MHGVGKRGVVLCVFLFSSILFSTPLLSSLTTSYLLCMMLAKEAAASDLTSEGGSVVVPPMPTSLVNGDEARLTMLCHMLGKAAVNTAAF